MQASGNRLETLHRMISSPKLSKPFAPSPPEIPKNLVRNAPISVPSIPAKLKILMRHANNTASTPGGHILAARTRVGIKANSPRTVNTTSSPQMKATSGIPSNRFV